jgi:hypothetical protein
LLSLSLSLCFFVSLSLSLFLCFSLSLSYSISHSIRQYPRDLKNQNILKKSCEIHCLYRNKKTSSLYILFIVIDLYIYS